jgi:dihydrolipoamide dehydrogenase
MKDLVIIGGGPGGYVAAIRARQLGMTVTLVEKEAVGGTCLNHGCIPTKAYYRNAEIMRDLSHAEEFGISVAGLKFSMQQARERKERIVKTLVSGVEKLLNDYGVEVIKGNATLLDRSTVAVGQGTCPLVPEQKIKAARILLATGSTSASLPITGLELNGVVDSTSLLQISEVPPRLAIVGGGVIGLEFACIFNSFGSQVTVIEYLPAILNLLDREISKRMGVFLKRQGITVHSSAAVEKVEQNGNELLLTAKGKKGDITIPADLVLVSAGRRPLTTGLNLETMGIATDEHGFIKVDENYATTVPGIYAIGDVIGGLMLAHVASEEGITAVEKMAGLHGQVHYNAVPSCIFTFPEIATVGMSEEECTNQGIKYRVGKFNFAANGKALTLGETDGLVKVIADEDDVIRGVHIIGPHASDLILEGTMLVKEEVKASDFVGTIHAHPTLGEAIMEAILDLNGQALHLSPRK